MIKKKESGPYWSRLTSDSRKVPYIHTDFNRWKDEDEDDSDEDGPGSDPSMQAVNQHPHFPPLTPSHTVTPDTLSHLHTHTLPHPHTLAHPHSLVHHFIYCPPMPSPSSSFFLLQLMQQMGGLGGGGGGAGGANGKPDLGVSIFHSQATPTW